MDGKEPFVSRRILHLLSQRPGRTGSGVTLAALVRHAAADGWDQRVVVGVPRDEQPRLPPLPPEHIAPLRFGTADLPFPVPGMSDVMPYQSTVFSRLTEAQLDRYRAAWRRHLAVVGRTWRPRLVHAHHLWLTTALARDVFPNAPLVAQCHATALRQRELCPRLADAARAGCRRADHFLVLHEEHARAVADWLDVPRARITVAGAGYREDLFRVTEPGRPRRRRMLYAGKLAAAKGVPWLLEAAAPLLAADQELELHLAGGGGGEEAAALAERLHALGPRVVWHGPVDQARLAALMNAAAVFVLPSLYEGLPLVLVEAAACGCRLVATALPGITTVLAPALGDRLRLVSPPRVRHGQRPDPADLPAFTARLRAALGTALAAAGDRPPSPPPAAALEPFTWGAVYRRVRAVWERLAAAAPPA